ncbi:hypothetical protein [Methyloferula stellata]|jgi:hypothetical protein|uniref:hypothetical protein n=1 Tax=Methyloferula stellata TaxID=876270 RepID=UPI00036DD2FD|nr:hypothetical protein [Methyloferula stellata]
MAEETQKYSAIPTLAEERMQVLRRQLLLYLYEKGAPPDHAMASASIEKDLEFTRDELRAVHMAILNEGLVAERARFGFIGLSQRGRIEAQALKDGD